ncbi:hypothetical protein D3C85_1123370 [compost metagenome]
MANRSRIINFNIGYVIYGNIDWHYTLATFVVGGFNVKSFVGSYFNNSSDLPAQVFVFINQVIKISSPV